MLVNMKMRECMPLAESTKVQLYISQVFVGELGSKCWGAGEQMDVFWQMQERAFRKTIVSSTPQDHKKLFGKTFFLFFKNSCERH